MVRPVLLLNIFALLFISEVRAQSDSWELQKDENGIKVYTKSNEGSDFDEFKALVTIPECSIADVMAVILDVRNYESWFPDCANPKVLDQIDKYHDIHYIETVAPWPVSNRYGVYNQSATLSDDNTKAEIVFTAEADYPIDEEDMVRITDAHGTWKLDQENNAVAVTYLFRGSPGGSIPAWMANAFVVQHPFAALTNLKALINKQ